MREVHRNVWPIDIGIQNAHFGSEGLESHGQIDAGGRFSDPAFSA